MHLESVKVGAHRRIPRAEFERYLDAIGTPPLAPEDFASAGMT